jgi:hypothetical protein
MVRTAPPKTTQLAPVAELPHRRLHLQQIDKTYANNRASSYTEKIEQLDDQFEYPSHRHHYWSDPQQSILYGTPLYALASEQQKLALNHLYWVFSYTATAAAEVQTALYNQVTAGVFATLGGYGTLCQELELETTQEKSHIHAFQKINYQTAKSLLGPKGLETLLKRRSEQQGHSPLSAPIYRTLRFATQQMLRQHRPNTSEYLLELERRSKFIPAPTTGFGYLGSGLMAQSLLRFFTFNWGSSPFLASQYYNVRFMANMVLKNREHRVFKHCRMLQKQGEFIPTPTAVSYYHLLDESFHTTMSQVIGRDLCQDFAPPTVYEKYLANLSIYVVQYNALRGLNAGIPGLYLTDDQFFMGFIYKLLQHPLFGITATDALHWVEQCFCQEHEGLQVAARWHHLLLKEFQRFFGDLAYLWPVNRDMRLMAAGGAIDPVVQRNRRIFKQFSQAIAQDPSA